LVFDHIKDHGRGKPFRDNLSEFEETLMYIQRGGLATTYLRTADWKLLQQEAANCKLLVKLRSTLFLFLVINDLAVAAHPKASARHDQCKNQLTPIIAIVLNLKNLCSSVRAIAEELGTTFTYSSEDITTKLNELSNALIPIFISQLTNIGYKTTEEWALGKRSSTLCNSFQ
jgi:hypothetical protein